jgi:hypothetical protein
MTLKTNITRHYHLVCLTTRLQPLPQRVLQRVRSSASSFNLQYLLVSLRSSSSCLHFLSLLPVPSIFPSVTCFRRQFLHKMWPILLAFLRFVLCRMFLSSFTLCNTDVTATLKMTNSGTCDFICPPHAWSRMEELHCLFGCHSSFVFYLAVFNKHIILKYSHLFIEILYVALSLKIAASFLSLQGTLSGIHMCWCAEQYVWQICIASTV